MFITRYCLYPPPRAHSTVQTNKRKHFPQIILAASKLYLFSKSLKKIKIVYTLRFHLRVPQTSILF